ncbi:AbrB/MazE/SpoVT family DNA-binding domain-containing protein [Aureispira anguillae]|uniref:AbrB/MazE/SpoVT family DNA-binding domain-containing protein n=1 Tax=Aureispira anguillae TaxID=2864201 RepID=A0A916DW04_9BACT|nr:AbrB/MazE/SpoVT family DNA-binding domain-containing protein [Aureispira anguillae]BDS15684.1 AbrB/MazE/SpoVT family DNA-binding domain-containing protein [Aureispira anguillae]
MNTLGTVSKWGQSLGIRIPKHLAQKMRIQEGEKVEMTFQNGGITIKPAMTIDWLMEGIERNNRHELILDDIILGEEKWWK